jgi:NAD-dependent DNA ligase
VSEDRKEIGALIKKRRLQILVARFLYYVRSESLVTDAVYDAWENELKRLVAAHPDIANAQPYASMCPSRTVGSSIQDDYPRAVEQLAESLLKHVRKSSN